MRFWGFYWLDEDTPDRKYVANTRIRHEIDPKIEATGWHAIPALPEGG
jgi:hypothetical protein